MSFFSEDVETGDNGSYRSSSDASSGSAPSAHGIDLGPAGHVVGIASMFSDAYSQIDSTGQISNVEQEFPSRLNEYSNFPTHQFDVSSTQDFEDRYPPLLIEYDNVADRAGYDISFFIEDYDQLSRRHVGVGADTQPRGVNPNDEASASLHEYCSSNHELGGILERSAAEHASTQTSCIGQVNTSFSSDRCTRKDRRSPSPWSPYLVANAMPLPARAHVNAGFAVGNMSIGSIRGSDLDSDWSMMSFDDRTTTSGLLGSPQFETDDSVATVSRSSIEGSWSEIHSSPAKEQYLQYPNGSLSAESYYGMPIDCTRSWNGTHTTTLLRHAVANFLNVSSPTPSAASLSSVTPTFEAESMICTLDGCNESFTGTYRRGNLARHIRNSHSQRTHTCAVRGCERVFRRSDARLKHQRKYHPELRLKGPSSRK